MLTTGGRHWPEAKVEGVDFERLIHCKVPSYRKWWWHERTNVNPEGEYSSLATDGPSSWFLKHKKCEELDGRRILQIHRPLDPLKELYLDRWSTSIETVLKGNGWMEGGRCVGLALEQTVPARFLMSWFQPFSRPWRQWAPEIEQNYRTRSSRCCCCLIQVFFGTRKSIMSRYNLLAHDPSLTFLAS